MAYEYTKKSLLKIVIYLNQKLICSNVVLIAYKNIYITLTCSLWIWDWKKKVLSRKQSLESSQTVSIKNKQKVNASKWKWKVTGFIFWTEKEVSYSGWNNWILEKPASVVPLI